MRLNFACLIFVARGDYENILTAKISRFTVLHMLIGIIMMLYGNITEDKSTDLHSAMLQA